MIKERMNKMKRFLRNKINIFKLFAWLLVSILTIQLLPVMAESNEFNGNNQIEEIATPSDINPKDEGNGLGDILKNAVLSLFAPLSVGKEIKEAIIDVALTDINGIALDPKQPFDSEQPVKLVVNWKLDDEWTFDVEENDYAEIELPTVFGEIEKSPVKLYYNEEE